LHPSIRKPDFHQIDHFQRWLKRQISMKPPVPISAATGRKINELRSRPRLAPEKRPSDFPTSPTPTTAQEMISTAEWEMW
jgi:hypothetical protein